MSPIGHSYLAILDATAWMLRRVKLCAPCETCAMHVSPDQVTQALAYWWVQNRMQDESRLQGFVESPNIFFDQESMCKYEGFLRQVWAYTRKLSAWAKRPPFWRVGLRNWCKRMRMLVGSLKGLLQPLVSLHSLDKVSLICCIECRNTCLWSQLRPGSCILYHRLVSVFCQLWWNKATRKSGMFLPKVCRICTIQAIRETLLHIQYFICSTSAYWLVTAHAMEVLLERLVKGANEIAADRADKSLGPAHLYASFVSQNTATLDLTCQDFDHIKSALTWGKPWDGGQDLFSDFPVFQVYLCFGSSSRTK